DIVKTTFDVSLDEPGRSLPRPLDFAESRVASLFGPEAMGVRTEPPFVVWFQECPQGFLEEFVAPGWNAERAFLPVCFGNLRSANGRPDIPVLPKQSDDVLDLLETHAIHCFRCGALGHGPGVPVDFTVGSEHEFGVEQVFVDSFQRNTSEP